MNVKPECQWVKYLFFTSHLKILFPTKLRLTQSWDAEILEEAGSVTAKEMRHNKNHWTFQHIFADFTLFSIKNKRDLKFNEI